MIRWREKFVAFGIHLFATLFVAGCAAALIFLVWFPAPFHEMLGGTKLFLLVVTCDVALGPLTSLVVYNSTKSRGKLIFDYVVIGIVQLASFAYGVYAVAEARPVYVVFVKDHFQVVCASEINPDELAQARISRFRSLPKFGPVLVGTYVPPADHNDALFKGLQGVDVPVRPRFYVDYDKVVDQVRMRANTLDKIPHPAAAGAFKTAVAALGRSADEMGWLAADYRTGAWTALVDRQTGRPVTYINLDPY